MNITIKYTGVLAIMIGIGASLYAIIQYSFLNLEGFSMILVIAVAVIFVILLIVNTMKFIKKNKNLNSK